MFKYNYSELKVGQMYKNYRELCAVLQCEPQSGNSKKAQFRDWDCHFLYSKSGNKFIIEEVYETPREREVKHGGARTIIFGDVIELLILDLLASSEDHLVIGKVKLMELVGMTNYNYKTGRNVMGKISKYLDTDVKVVQDFYRTNDSNFKSAIESALKRLKDKRLIDFYTVTKIRDVNTGKFRVATDEELTAILLVENRVMRSLGFYNIKEVRQSREWHRFKNKCKDMLHGFTDIDYYFSAYKILMDKEYIQKEKVTA